MLSSNWGARALKVDLCKYKSLTQVGNGVSLCACIHVCVQANESTAPRAKAFSPPTPPPLGGTAHSLGPVNGVETCAHLY